MKTETFPANVFRANPQYVRVKVSQAHVDLMADKLKESKGAWPFPPIKAQPIPIGEEKLISEGYRLFIIDGHHRVEAAMIAGVDVQAVVHSGLSKVEAICMQVKENVANGLAFDYAARKRAIDMMKAEGMKQVEICQKTGLPKYTVSRVLSADPNQVSGAEGDARKGKGAKPPGGKKFDAERWEKALSKVVVDWGKHRTKIKRAKSFPEGLDRALDAVADCLIGKEEKE